MQIVAAVFADFVDSFLGGVSPLRTPLGSRTVIEHTLSRVLRIAGVDRCCLVVRPRDEQLAREVVRELGVGDSLDLLPIDDGARPRRPLFRSGRVWGLESWRGSPLATWFDEYVEPVNVARVLDHYRCEAVLCLDGCQPVLDLDIAARMIAYQREHEADARFVFTQAPPGLAGLILRRAMVQELLKNEYPVSLLLTYRPELAQTDPITKEPCCRIHAEVSRTSARFTADTIKSRELLTDALRDLGEDCTAESLCEWICAKRRARVERLPAEVELEITTDDPLPESTLRPRGDRTPSRRLMDLEAVSCLVEQLTEYDDRLLVLSGHGDPLLHPRFPEICRRIRDGGVCGFGVVTSLVEMSDANLDALIGAKVDLLEVQLDASTTETYRKVHNADAFANVLHNLETLLQARKSRQSPQPIVACGLTRCAATLDELEPFFEQWIKMTGWALIRGYNDYCGLLPPDSVLAMRPPLRGPCRRLDSRMMLLADGRSVLCGQDVSGVTATGSWIEQPLADLWKCDAITTVRAAHRRRDFSATPLCQSCGEWHRP